MSSTQVTVDLSAAEYNLQRVRTLAPNSKIIAMVKGNAYGHGLGYMARAFHDADALGVARFEEAIYVRQFLLEQPIVIMGGCFSADNLPLCAAFQFDIVVHQQQQIEALLAAKLDRPINVWLKIDTGMHRLGIQPEHFAKHYERLQASPNVGTLRLMTHLAAADESDKSFTLNQLEVFQNCVQDYPNEISIANSAAILNWPETHADWIRPGIMLYGASPFADKTGSDHGLKPVTTFHSQLIDVKYCKKGECVGYGHRIECPEDMPIGVVAAGYGDGYPRHAADGAPVLVNNTVVPLFGRVSMDLVTVDLRQCSHAQIGDRVVLWGNGLPIERVSRYCASWSPYDLMCAVKAGGGHVRNHTQYLWDERVVEYETE